MPKSSDLDADYNFDGTSNRTEERQLSDHIQQCKDISVLRSEMRRKNREKQREYRLQLEAKVAALEAALIRRTRKHERDNLFGDDASKAIPGPEPFDMGEQFSRNVKPVVEESHLYQIAAQVPKGFHLHLPFEVERALELLRKMPRIPPHILRSTEPIFRDEHDAQRNFLHPAPVENGAPQDRLDRGVRIFEIPCIVAKHSTKSLGDYGAKQNFMSESYALRLGLSIDRTTVHKVTIGSGKYVNTTGTVSAPFRFKKEHETYDLKWHLLPNCIHDIVLGKQFLKASETFSNLSNWVRRVKEKVVRGISQFHLLYLGNSSPMFEGYVNGRAQTALADSGSKVLVMDKAYARHLGVDMHTGREHRTRLKFADGSSANTSGMAYGVEWRFGRDDEYTAPYQLDFHILENAPANVILCDTFLFDTRAFSRYQGFLLDDDQYDDDNDEGEFFAIDIDRKSKKGSGPAPAKASSLAELQHLERICRDESEDRIDRLPKAQQAEARQLENARRVEWDRTFAALRLSQSTQSSPQPTASAASTQVPSPVATEIGRLDQTVDITGKSWWRLLFSHGNACRTVEGGTRSSEEVTA